MLGPKTCFLNGLMNEQQIRGLNGPAQPGSHRELVWQL